MFVLCLSHVGAVDLVSQADGLPWNQHLISARKWDWIPLVVLAIVRRKGDGNGVTAEVKSNAPARTRQTTT